MDENDLIDKYNEVALQFGYIVLFAPAFPIAPLVAIIANAIQIRADLNQISYFS